MKNLMESLSKINYWKQNRPKLKNINVYRGDNLKNIKYQLQDTDVKQLMTNLIIPSVQRYNFQTEE